MSVAIKISQAQHKALDFADVVVVTGKGAGAVFVGHNAQAIKLLLPEATYNELKVGDKLNIVDGVLQNTPAKAPVNEPVRSNPDMKQMAHRFPQR